MPFRILWDVGLYISIIHSFHKTFNVPCGKSINLFLCDFGLGSMTYFEQKSINRSPNVVFEELHIST